ncbi:hypothetical protein B586_20200 [Mycobacterium haemophilum DSM 44634]|nr:hypothetical protein B586_20200 [Mycobacterium haemophilum DSM 44634]
MALLSVWYGHGNVAFRLLSAIVRQGVDEGQFIIAYPEQAGAIIFVIIQSLQKSDGPAAACRPVSPASLPKLQMVQSRSVPT